MNSLRRKWLATTLALAVSWALASSVQAQSRADRVRTYLQAFHDLRLFHGAALVIEDGEVLFEGAFGEADVVAGAANTAQTRFRIASLTKQFTAALILRLDEEELLRIDDPVGRYIEEYPPENAERITLHHLLTHTSGLPSYTNLPGFMESRTEIPLSPGEILALTWEKPLSFEPGTDFEYSNSGYVLLGWIAERVTGMSYEEALQSYVLGPLELTDTGYDHHVVPAEGHATGHTRELTGYRSARLIDPSLPHAAGMLYSTVGDLARWATAMFPSGIAVAVGEPPGNDTDDEAGEEIEGQTGEEIEDETGAASADPSSSAGGALFRNAATLARMTTPALQSYAYGLVVRSRPIGHDSDVPIIEHSGGIFGFSSQLRVFPDQESLIVLLDNTSSDLGRILEGLTNILWGVEAVLPKPSIAERLLPIVQSGGVEAAMSRYDNWRLTRPDEYDYSPAQLFMLAGHFREEDPATAIAILEAYVKTTPEAAGVRFALSELHEEAGDLESAVAHITAALTYEPGVRALLDRLGELGVEPDPILLLPVVEVDPDQLPPLVGEYRIDPATTLTVTLEEGVLMAGRSGEDAFPLLPQAPTAFLLHGSAVQFVFEIRDGMAAAVSVVESEQRLTFPRIGS